MRERSAEHGTFVIERRLPAPPRRAFAAWSDPALKRRWSSCHEDWRQVEHRLDLRVGGNEITRMVDPDGAHHLVSARFLDVIPDERIVYVYEMSIDGRRLSVSLVTVTFQAQPMPGRRTAGTLMTFTEQAVLLDGGGDLLERRGGTEEALDRLGPLLQEE